MSSLFGLNKLRNKMNNNINNSEEKVEVNKLPKKKIEIENHIKDLENTIKINQEYIYNIILVLNINQKNKKRLIDALENIKLLFDVKKKYRKETVDISSKILINKQIIEEMRRRNNENNIYQNDKISNLKESVNKKGLIVKNFIKKFNELEIFVQRESKLQENIEKYGKYNSFTIIPFMKKNEFLLKQKKFYEIDKKNKEKIINQLESETKFLKQSKNVKNIFEQNYIHNNTINEIHNYYSNLFILREKEIDYFKSLNILLIKYKFNQKNKLINDTIFENKIDRNELANINKDNKKETNNKNNENDFLFVINETDNDIKEITDMNNYWIDSEPEEF